VTRSAEITNAIAAARRDLEARQTQHAALTEEVGRLQGGIQRMEGEIDGALRALPEECRDPAVFEVHLEESRSLAQQLHERFAVATDAVNQATIAEAKAASTALSLSGQLATAGEALERSVQEFGSRLTKHGFADRSDFESAELEPDELAAQRSVLDAFHTEVASVAAEKDALGRKLEGTQRPDLDALESALLAAQARASQAEAAATEAERLRDDIKRGHERLMELESRDARLAERRTAAVKLDQLANGQLAGRTKVKLETFVLQSIFHEVLDEGNRHLRHMTGGRYTLVLRESLGASGSGLELDVRDNAVGTDTRPVTTLSGGEGFLASLSLALGLSEVAQRRSGGLELGALFIDEGFGSLDAQALDQVIDILRGLQDGRRMVGVISHVEELKRRIPAQLHVVTGRDGSTVEMRLND
jgi:exonuclease SbcC